MKLRVITAVVGIPLLLTFVYFDFEFRTAWFERIPLFISAVGAAAAAGAWEFYRLGNNAGARPLTAFGIAWAVLFVVAALFNGEWTSSREAASYVDWAMAGLLGSAIVLPLVWVLIFQRDAWQQSWVWTLAGILYLGWMLSYYVMLRQLDEGRELVILALFTTFACDTTAYFVGRAWGKHHMTPAISPHKTWEGAAGGLLGAVAAAALLCFLLNLGDWALPLNYLEAVGMGCLIGVVAQLGDLLESVLKRRAGVKDSGRILPGHGGVLDRIDSLVFIGVIVYYFVLWVD
ncbi:MAG: CDP-archaeol synthase [Dehalococcoidia bacterium]|nr:CDP-archaeol synthase [Dehalococcoidia bacterium]